MLHLLYSVYTTGLQIHHDLSVTVIVTVTATVIVTVTVMGTTVM